MNFKIIETIIVNAVGPHQLYEYMTAEHGNYAGVYSGGQFATGSSVGNEIAENERPIAMVKCPGIGNIDSSYWTDDWTEFDEESGKWIVTEESDGCNVGDRLDLAQCIYICCADGDVLDHVENLKNELIESIE